MDGLIQECTRLTDKGHALQLRLTVPAPPRINMQVLPTSHFVRRREDARFVYKRIPLIVRDGHAGIEGAFALLQALWARDFAQAWARLRRDWGDDEPARRLATALEAKLRTDVWEVLADAYTSIRLSVATQKLGLESGEAAVKGAVGSIGGVQGLFGCQKCVFGVSSESS